jgi:hypothetical protein
LMRRGAVFPFGVFAFRGSDHFRRRSGRCLSCGSPGLRRFSPTIVEPYWLGSPPSPFSPNGTLASASGSSDRRVACARCEHHARATSPAFGRHSRVHPQRLVPNTSELFERRSFLRGKRVQRLSVPCRAFARRGGIGDASHGVRYLSAYEPGRSLYRFASPVPSALRVSHPLSGLIPPWPRGFVSRHIRP